MDIRLSKWVSPEKYYQKSYLMFLKDKGRLTLFDFEGDALNKILQAEREKLEKEKLNMFQRHREEKAREHVKRSKGWFKSIPRKLKHYSRAQSDDLYLISYLLDNLQEYDMEGNNITYLGMSI